MKKLILIIMMLAITTGVGCKKAETKNRDKSLTAEWLDRYSDLSGKTITELRLIRNEIYARHGYIFKSKELQEYFNRREWYKPNENFSQNQLSEKEEKLISQILELEKKSKKDTEQVFHTYPITTCSIRAIDIDNNLVWFATEGDGVLVYNKKNDKWKSYTTKDGLPSNDITALAIDKDYIWIGTYENGAAKFDKKEKKWTAFDVLSPIYAARKRRGYGQELRKFIISAIAVDDEYVWFGLDGGMRGGGRRYDKNKNLWHDVECKVWPPEYRKDWKKEDSRKITPEMRKKYIEVKSVRTIKSGKWTDNRNSEPFSDVIAIAIDGDDVWFATYSGIHRYNKKDKNWIAYKDQGALYPEILACNFVILSIGKEKDYMWFSTELTGEPHGLLSNGADCYDKRNNTWKRYENVLSHRAFSIVVDNDKVWFGTTGELSIFDRQNNKWKSYTSNHGLANDFVRSMKVDKDCIWLGTDSGISVFKK